MTVSANPTPYIVQGLKFIYEETQDGTITIEELKDALARSKIRGEDAAAVLALFRMWDYSVDGYAHEAILVSQLDALDNYLMSLDATNGGGRNGLDAIRLVIKGDMYLRDGWFNDRTFTESIFQVIANTPFTTDQGGALNERNFMAWLNTLNLPEKTKEQLRLKFLDVAGGDGIMNKDDFPGFISRMGKLGMFTPHKDSCRALNGETKLIQTYDPTDKEQKTVSYADKLFTNAAGGLYVNSNDLESLFEKGGPLSSLTEKQRKDLMKAFETYCTTKGIADNKTGGMTREEFQKFWKLHAPE